MKKIGLAALEQRRNQQQKYQEVGGILAKSQADKLNTQLRELQLKLEEYGTKNAITIKKSSQNRSEYAKLCGKMGILSTEKSIESLATRLIEICRALRNENGGVISVKSLQNIVEAEENQRFSQDLIVKAIKHLEPLGPGMTIETLPSGIKVVRSTLHQLSTDQADVIVACDALGFVSVPILADNLKWTHQRAQQCLDDMVQAGLLWVDEQSEVTEYWSLGAFR